MLFFRSVCHRLWRYVWFRYFVLSWVRFGLPGGDWIFLNTPAAVALHQLFLKQGMFVEAKEISSLLRRRGYVP